MGENHLAELFRLLYPEPYQLDLPGATRQPGAPVGGARRPGASAAEYLLLPNARRPRLALPAGPAHLRVAPVRHLPRPARATERVRNSAVRGVLRVSGVALRDRVRVRGTGDSLPGYLCALLGEPVTCCVHVGGALRANRKPVLELLDAAGAPLGFAKLGVNELTRGLVRAEALALHALGAARLRQVTVPRLRHSGTWRGHELLVQQALPVWRPVAAGAEDAVRRAMVEVAAATGLISGAFGTSGYRQQLTRRLDAIVDRPGVPDPTLGAALHQAGRDAFAKADELVLTFGAWHGDWTPWNTHATGSTVLVWDWERFGTGVPVGLDALHWQLQGQVDAGTPARAAADALAHRAAGLLAPFGVGPAAARFTALLYLLDLGARYLADRLDTGRQRLAAVGDWLLPAVRSEIDQARWVEGD